MGLLHSLARWNAFVLVRTLGSVEGSVSMEQSVLMVHSNFALERTGLAWSRARVRARPLAWHGRALDALRPAAQLGR